MDGYDACMMYLAMKLHFTPGTYDYQRYYGKTPLKVETYETRRDKWFFHKLSKKYPQKDTLEFFLAVNFFHRPVVWVRDLLMEESHEVYLQYLKVKESLEYVIDQDLNVILAECPDFKECLRKPKDGPYPPLLDMAFQDRIHRETLIVLDQAIRLFPVWNTKITDTIIYPVFAHKCIRYASFLELPDMKIFRAWLKKRLTE